MVMDIYKACNKILLCFNNTEDANLSEIIKIKALKANKCKKIITCFIYIHGFM